MAKCAIGPCPLKSRTTFRSRALLCNTGLRQYHAANAQPTCHHKPSSSNGLPRTCARYSGEKSAKKNDGSSALNAGRPLKNPRRESHRRGSLPHANLLSCPKDERTAVSSLLSTIRVAHASFAASCAMLVVCKRSCTRGRRCR